MSKELEALNEIFRGMQNVGGYVDEFKIVRKGIEKLDRIQVLVDVRRFKTEDSELLRDAIREVLNDDV